MSDLITRPWPFELETLRTGLAAAHAYERRYGPLTANPFSRARFTLARNTPGTPATRAAFFITSSATGAILEVILRHAAPDQSGGIYVAPGALAGWSIAFLELRQDIPQVLRVDRPHRLRFVEPDSLGDDVWHQLCGTPVHALTHGAAHEVNGFLAGHGIQHAGLGWRSRQWPDDVVRVLYDPPFAAGAWHHRNSVDLDSKAGLALVQTAVLDAGWRWLAPPHDATATAEVPEP